MEGKAAQPCQNRLDESGWSCHRKQHSKVVEPARLDLFQWKLCSSGAGVAAVPTRFQYLWSPTQDGEEEDEIHPNSLRRQGLHPSAAAGPVVPHGALLPQTNHSVCLNPAAGGTGTAHHLLTQPPPPRLPVLRCKPSPCLAAESCHNPVLK